MKYVHTIRLKNTNAPSVTSLPRRCCIVRSYSFGFFFLFWRFSVFQIDMEEENGAMVPGELLGEAMHQYSNNDSCLELAS